MIDDNESTPEKTSGSPGLGAEALGSLAGATIGLLAGGAEGAIVGAAAAPIFTHMSQALHDFAQRLLGQQERVRVSATMRFAESKIATNIANGLSVRQDDFFYEKPDERYASSEIIEGVLLSAQRDHQERKIKYYGNLLANIAFRPDVDTDLANAIIRKAEQMSYRQMLILALAMRVNELDSHYKGDTWNISQARDSDSAALLQDIQELTQMALIPGDRLDDRGLVSTRMEVTILGILTFELLSLEEVELYELKKLFKLLELTNERQNVIANEYAKMYNNATTGG